MAGFYNQQGERTLGILWNGVLVNGIPDYINFTGAGVTVTDDGMGGVIVDIPGTGIGSQTAIQFKDEGVNLGTSGTVDTVDFVGGGVTATRIGNVVTVTIPAGGGGTVTGTGVAGQVTYWTG